MHACRGEMLLIAGLQNTGKLHDLVKFIEASVPLVFGVPRLFPIIKPEITT